MEIISPLFSGKRLWWCIRGISWAYTGLPSHARTAYISKPPTFLPPTFLRRAAGKGFFL